MPDNATITRAQLLTVLRATELGGKTVDVDRFSFAQLGSSTYSFGQMQFDVGKGGTEVSGFLKANGFNDDDVKNLSKHGGLSRKELDSLNAKLAAVPKDKMEAFTNKQLDKAIAGVDDAIDGVRGQNAAAADAISKDTKLQLGIADYENQFGKAGPHFVGFLAGKPETLGGVEVRAGDPPTREDVQRFIEATAYGRAKSNAQGVASREERFDGAMAELKLGAATKTDGATVETPGATFGRGAMHDKVSVLQDELSQLGYKDGKDHPLGVDGKFGNHTREALEKFQTDQGLPPNGRVTRETEKAALGALHAKVCELQDGLVRLGYKDEKGRPLEVDGELGAHTRNALKKFQADHGVAADGEVNPETGNAMKAALKPEAKSVPPSTSQGLDSLDNPHHAMYEQALAGVHKLDAAIGRTPDERSAQLAGAATAEAIAKGLTRIDSVVMSADGERTFAVQNTWPLMTIADVSTLQALNTPLQQSNAAAEAAAQTSLKDSAQMQAPPTQNRAAALMV